MILRFCEIRSRLFCVPFVESDGELYIALFVESGTKVVTSNTLQFEK